MDGDGYRTTPDTNRRRVGKWVRLEALPERFQCDPKPTSPMRFHAQLQELMRRDVTKVRWLFDEAKAFTVARGSR